MHNRWQLPLTVFNPTMFQLNSIGLRPGTKSTSMTRQQNYTSILSKQLQTHKVNLFNEVKHEPRNEFKLPISHHSSLLCLKSDLTKQFEPIKDTLKQIRSIIIINSAIKPSEIFPGVSLAVNDSDASTKKQALGFAVRRGEPPPLGGALARRTWLRPARGPPPVRPVRRGVPSPHGNAVKKLASSGERPQYNGRAFDRCITVALLTAV